MARRTPPPSQSHALGPDEMRTGIGRLNKRIAELQAFDPSSVMKRWPPEARVLETAIEGTLASIFGHDTPDYRRYQRATTLDHGSITMDTGFGEARDDTREAREYLTEGKQEAIMLLQQAVRELEERLEPTQAGSVRPPNDRTNADSEPPRKVFVVHGHESALTETVARFVGKLGLEPIILHERANRGRTIIAKFREESAEVGFAVVLMTADDVGRAARTDVTDLKPRARQNVVLELGFFIGALGPSHVVAIVDPSIELPSDYDGVVYIKADNWRAQLARELHAGGFKIDALAALS